MEKIKWKVSVGIRTYLKPLGYWGALGKEMGLFS
jgi:hypothetical protein